MKVSLIFILLSLVVSCAHVDPSCVENRGAFDIGSGSIKAYAAKVDICRSRILETLYDQSIPISFSEGLSQSKENRIPDSLVLRANQEIRLKIMELREFELKRLSATATAAFRLAKNGKLVTDRIEKETGLAVQIISQDEEAMLGVLSAQAMGADFSSPFVVWDIGGGSMQMSTQVDEKWAMYRGEMAAVSFKNEVIKKVLKKDPKIVSSPNPIGEQWKAAVALAEQYARDHVPQTIQSLGSEVNWYGIGGVHAASIKNQLGGLSVVTRIELERALEERSKLTDDQIISPYKSTEITNMALVLGYMKALQIKKVYPIEASLVQGRVVQKTHMRN